MAIRKSTGTLRRSRVAPQARRERKTHPTLDWIIALGKTIPVEEQANHPADGAENLEHYLYGSPKQT